MWRSLSRAARRRLVIAAVLGAGIAGLAIFGEVTGRAAVPLDLREVRRRVDRRTDELVRRVDVARRTAVNQLLGGHAAPGPVLDSFQWVRATPVARDDGAVARITGLLAPLGAAVRYDDEAGSDGTLAIAMTAPVTRDELVGVWGPPDRGNDTWIDPVGHWCATFRDGTLAWRRCQGLDQLFGPQAPAVFAFERGPMLGASTDAARRMAGATATEGADYLRWHDDGLIDGALPVEVTAQLARDRVIGYEVRIPTANPAAVHATLTATLGGRATWTGGGRTVAIGPDQPGVVTLTIKSTR